MELPLSYWISPSSGSPLKMDEPVMRGLVARLGINKSVISPSSPSLSREEDEPRPRARGLPSLESLEEEEPAKVRIACREGMQFV